MGADNLAFVGDDGEGDVYKGDVSKTPSGVVYLDMHRDSCPLVTEMAKDCDCHPQICHEEKDLQKDEDWYVVEQKDQPNTCHEQTDDWDIESNVSDAGEREKIFRELKMRNI